MQLQTKMWLYDVFFTLNLYHSYTNFTPNFRRFLPRDTAILARPWESQFCPSVCHTRALWQNQTMHCGYFDTTLVFSHQQWLVDDAPFCLKFALQVTHLFEKRWLRQISAYNVSTVKDSEKVQSWRVDYGLSNELYMECIRYL